MTPNRKTKTGNKDDILQQQDVMQAVVIAENYNNNFAPLTADKPSALFPIVNKYLIDYTLEALERCGIQEAFVFCSSHAQKVRNHINKNWSGKRSLMTVTTISSDNFMSLGDAIRELDSKALIRSDFVLIDGHVITTFNLKDIMDEHRKRRKIDKGCAMTLIYNRLHPQHKLRSTEDDTLVVVEANTKKILYFQKINNKCSVNVPLEVFQANDDVMVHYDICDSHVCICSPSVPPLYADNFDYQTFDDLTKGLLINEEVLGNSLYLHIPNTGYGGCVSSLNRYDTVSQDIISRWSYPVVPDLFDQNESIYCHLRHNIYIASDKNEYKNCILHQNVVIGKGTTVGDNTFIEDTVIGHNCHIGANVTIKGSYIWDNVVIGDNCELHTCLLADNVILKTYVKIEPGCVLSSKVIIGDYVTLPPLTKLQFEPPTDDFDEGKSGIDSDIAESAAVCDDQYVGVNGHGFLFVQSEDSDTDSDNDDDKVVPDVWSLTSMRNKLMEYRSDDECESVKSKSDVFSNRDDDEECAVPEEEDAMLFYNEVLDSLQRGIEEKIKSENLILEINSSKYAYNVTMKEVNTLVMKAILSIPIKEKTMSSQEYFAKLKPMLSIFLPLISNYIKNTESQLDCLQSIEEFFISAENLSPACMKILHMLYENDVLSESVIIKWYAMLPKENENIRKQITPFIKWLKEADEESSDD